MGIMLFDRKNQGHTFDVNSYHWRAIVEEIRRLSVLPNEVIDSLHEQFVGGLSLDQAHLVAKSIREKVLPSLEPEQRILLDGARTTEPDDFTLYKTGTDRNYSTDARALEEFAEFCGQSDGFAVG